MLAVFYPIVAKMDPAMKNPESIPICTTTGCFLARRLLDYYPRALTLKFGEAGYLAIEDHPNIRKIEVHEDVFCLFYGMLENTKNLRDYLKLSGSVSDPRIVIELYKMWKGENAHMVDSPLGEAEGSFSFILYDRTCDYVAIGVDAEGNMPLYWGTDSHNNLVVTSMLLMAKKGCSRSYAAFPPGFLYTSSNGLMHFKHPLSILESVPWTDNKGGVCGANFIVRAMIEGQFHSVCNYPEPKQ